MTLDDVIDKIKKAYAAKFAAIKDSTNNVRNAVNKYEAAAQDDALISSSSSIGCCRRTRRRKQTTRLWISFSPLRSFRNFNRRL